MSTKKSSLVDQIGGAFPAPVDPGYEGELRVKHGVVACLTTDLEADDVIILADFGPSDRILKIELANDDLDGGSAILFDVGLWADVDAATALDDDVYATVSTNFQSATGFTDYAHEARGIELAGQTVWADAGESSLADFKANGYTKAFVGIHIDTVAGTPAAGDIAFRITYVDG